MLKWLNSLFVKKPKNKRLYLRLVSYADAIVLLDKGWSLAEEDNDNSEIGKIYLELLEKTQKNK